MIYVFIIEHGTFDSNQDSYRIGISPNNPDDMLGEEMDDTSFFIDEDFQHNTRITDKVRAEATQHYIINLLNKGINFKEQVVHVPYK